MKLVQLCLHRSQILKQIVLQLAHFLSNSSRVVSPTSTCKNAGIKIALDAGIIEPDRAVVIGDSIRDDGQIEWLNYTDDSPAVPSKNTSIALTGKVWEYLLDHDPKSALEYAKRTKVFGRCRPDDKVSIVNTFVEMGEITLMCGDGGNDCGALKAAHVGIALSDAEASVVAPFTSLDKSITSVTEV